MPTSERKFINTRTVFKTIEIFKTRAHETFPVQLQFLGRTICCIKHQKISQIFGDSILYHISDFESVCPNNTPGTSGWSGLCDRTLTVKSRKSAFFRKKSRIT